MFWSNTQEWYSLPDLTSSEQTYPEVCLRFEDHSMMDKEQEPLLSSHLSQTVSMEDSKSPEYQYNSSGEYTSTSESGSPSYSTPSQSPSATPSLYPDFQLPPFDPHFQVPAEYGLGLTLPPLDSDEIPQEGSNLASTSKTSTSTSSATRVKKVRSHASKKSLDSTKVKGKGKSVRKPTEIVVSDVVYEKNTGHIFVVSSFEGELPKADVNNDNISELILDDSNEGPLVDAFVNNTPYGPRGYTLDVNRGSRYTFTSSPSPERATRHWEVVFTPFRTEISPLGVTSTPGSIHRVFHHFEPDSIVVRPAYEIGTAAWWRVQICERVHPKSTTPDKFWTVRYDKDEKKRRPSRIVDHFAGCKHRQSEGDWFSLGKLATEVQRSFPETSRRKK